MSAIDVEVARIEAEADEARRRLEHAGTDERAEGDDRDELAERAERLERRREALGQVNPLAKEEYDAEKARLDELATQRKDLEASLAELEKLRAELTETVERRFAETFDAVQTNFAEVAATLFPGGEGRLQLDRGRRRRGAQPGIEVHLRPAGKKVQRLSLLSGGEKALGAISFLFALFLARPCPFYLLDEVEAALDDTNIGRFVELLRSYSDRAQFVVITHQKRTMEAADVLYGVTMGGDGVSQIVSRRLPREEAEAVSRRVATGSRRRWRGAGHNCSARPTPRPSRRSEQAGHVLAAARLALEVAARAHRADRGRRVRPRRTTARLGAARGGADHGRRRRARDRRARAAARGARRARRPRTRRSRRRSRRSSASRRTLHVDGSAERDPRRRRQRHRQDDDDRQARVEARRARPLRRRRRGRHVPRRRRGAARDLGGARRAPTSSAPSAAATPPPSPTTRSRRRRRAGATS